MQIISHNARVVFAILELIVSLFCLDWAFNLVVHSYLPFYQKLIWDCYFGLLSDVFAVMAVSTWENDKYVMVNTQELSTAADRLLGSNSSLFHIENKPGEAED